MLVCPKCNIEYEDGKKYCRKCGSFLLSEEGSTFELPIVEPTELEKPGENLFCPQCQKSYKKGKYCRNCGSLLIQGIPSQAPPVQFIEKSPIQRVAKERLKLFLRPLPLILTGVVIILIVIGGYFLRQRNDQTSQPIATPFQSPSPNIEINENEKVESLFEKIKQANLKKDIDLFMSCYSLDFKDRKSKEFDTLESWKNFDYLDLTYHLEKQTISGNMANARVEWQMKVNQKGSKQPEDVKTVLDVVLKREGGLWKIEEIKPAT